MATGSLEWGRGVAGDRWAIHRRTMGLIGAVVRLTGKANMGFGRSSVFQSLPVFLDLMLLVLGPFLRQTQARA